MRSWLRRVRGSASGPVGRDPGAWGGPAGAVYRGPTAEPVAEKRTDGMPDDGPKVPSEGRETRGEARVGGPARADEVGVPPDGREARVGGPAPDVEPGPAGAAPASTGPAGAEAGMPPARDDLPRIGFVGAGRVGTALGVALRRAGWPVTAVSSRDPERRERFATLVPGARPFVEPPAILDDCDLVLVTVPDDAVPAVAAGLHLYSGQAIVHTSGVLASDVLMPALAAGTERGSFHPLVAFADHESALRSLPGSAIAIEGDESLLPLLADLALALGARPLRVSPAGKAAHHAAAVLAAGGVVALLDAVAALGRAAGLDERASLTAYAPLAGGGLQNAEELGIARALTGPVVRGDAGTIRAHLDAIRRLAPDVEPVYAALVRRQVALARSRGDLAAEPAAAILEALGADGGSGGSGRS